MTQRSMSLLDVLAPPGNDWLRELCRRKTDLPPGVKVVRFSEVEDDLTDDEAEQAAVDERKQIAA